MKILKIKKECPPNLAGWMFLPKILNKNYEIIENKNPHLAGVKLLN